LPSTDTTADAKHNNSLIPYFYRALEHTTIYVFTPAVIENIIQTYPSFQKVELKYYQQAMMAAFDHHVICNSYSAEQRYKMWLEKEPELAKRLPQYMIASYLDILPTSLSRIRNQMHRK
jgi:CRP-like cAMP-binding protein